MKVSVLRIKNYVLWKLFCVLWPLTLYSFVLFYIKRNTTIQKTQEANSDLYTSQPFDVNYSLLDNPPNPSTNELLYSGGETNMINIPLQMNSPNEEQLRTQKILITPYNKIKYGNC